MKIPTDAPVKIVMLGAGGTGRHIAKAVVLCEYVIHVV